MSSDAISPLCQRMIEDMKARKLNPHTQRSHDTRAFAAFLVPLRRSEWVVYSKKPFGGPEAVLAYLARYTHRVAISNRRLIAADAMDITFKYKDYRIQGPERCKLMTLATDEFIRRFLKHVLPKCFHRIRNYGLLANGSRADNIARARALLNVPKPDAIPDDPKSADAARAADARASMPMLRRPHAHHRYVRTGMRAEIPAGHRAPRDQDRYLMIEIALSTGTQRRIYRDATPSSCRCPLASADGARSTMPSQRLAIAVATPNLNPMSAAHAPLDQSTRQSPVRP